MNIAIIGGGISGLVSAYLLARQHQVTLFEANHYPGGHTNTITVPHAGQALAIDTGFIVFNDRTYPNFIRLLAQLGVESQPSDMSFSVQCERTGLEYAGSSLNTLFAQRTNLLNPCFYRMIQDILRFNREAPTAARVPGADRLTLGEYLRQGRYSPQFAEHYIVPMGAAIWSAESAQMEQFPLRYFVQFFENHGLLALKDRPVWRVIRGGSARYVAPLIAPFRDRLRLNTPVARVARHTDNVEVVPVSGPAERFDHVVFATHSDQTLAILGDKATERERAVLGEFRYQRNEAVLHTDARLLPRARRAWASWNAFVRKAGEGRSAAVTYWMNRLQSLSTDVPYCVSLNSIERIDPAKILGQYIYHHPVYTAGAVAAQARHAEINGQNRTSFCGAYWGYGFHEDGVNSALAVCRPLGVSL